MYHIEFWWGWKNLPVSGLNINFKLISAIPTISSILTTLNKFDINDMEHKA